MKGAPGPVPRTITVLFNPLYLAEHLWMIPGPVPITVNLYFRVIT